MLPGLTNIKFVYLPFFPIQNGGFVVAILGIAPFKLRSKFQR